MKRSGDELTNPRSRGPSCRGAARRTAAGRSIRRQALWDLKEDLFGVERDLVEQGFSRIAGVDEAGRGPLAGPVVAAAVVLDPDTVGRFQGLTDSKLLTPAQRDFWFDRISAWALDFSIARSDPEEIDALNILVATRRAMEKAVQGLSQAPDHLLIDGIVAIESPIRQWCLKRGDSRSLSIAAASVLAKVTRDRFMAEQARLYPQYRFAKNKGYGTREHLESLRRFGCCPLHRKTFRGVREVLGRSATAWEAEAFLPGLDPNRLPGSV